MPERSEDWIEGTVLRIINGDTFELQVEKEGKNNDYPYSEWEVIRLDKNAPPLETEEGEDAKAKLEALLTDQKVRCYVKSRDEEDVLTCEVLLLS